MRRRSPERGIDGLEKLPAEDPGTDPDKPGTTPGDDTGQTRNETGR